MNLTTALDVFEENLTDIKQSMVQNRDHQLSLVKKPDIGKCKSHIEYWIRVNLYSMEREQINKKYNNAIRAIEIRSLPKREGQITEADIQRAKDYPIQNLLEVTRKGNISCPFHQDKNPSFQIKRNNKFQCYSCGEYGDVLDLYQKLHNKSFVEAVKALS